MASHNHPFEDLDDSPLQFIKDGRIKRWVYAEDVARDLGASCRQIITKLEKAGKIPSFSRGVGRPRIAVLVWDRFMVENFGVHTYLLSKSGLNDIADEDSLERIAEIEALIAEVEPGDKPVMFASEVLAGDARDRAQRAARATEKLVKQQQAANSKGGKRRALVPRNPDYREDSPTA